MKVPRSGRGLHGMFVQYRTNIISRLLTGVRCTLLHRQSAPPSVTIEQ